MKSTDKDIRRIHIIKRGHGFVVEIIYTNGKIATFSVDGLDLYYVFDAINKQNEQVHRKKTK